MKLSLDIRKTVDENAKTYFELSKKAKRKAEGARKALTKGVKEKQQRTASRARKAQWYERFRWSRTRDGVLLVGGKDAATNEELVKKHLDADDRVFHTDMAGSPFVALKGKASKGALQDAAEFTAACSRAWRNGYSSIEVFHVAPSQVSKQAASGESLGRGAFMIRGDTSYIEAPVRYGLGVTSEGIVLGGPIEGVRSHCDQAYEILQGKETAATVAKQLAPLLGCKVVDIEPRLPPGGSRLGSKIYKGSTA